MPVARFPMIESDDDTPEWERMAGEPTRAYSAFRAYKDQPAHLRTVDEAARAISVTVAYCRRLATRWSWRDRAEAWDTAVYRAADAERLAGIPEMQSLHIHLGRLAVNKALERIEHLEPDDLDTWQAIRLMETGTKLEREMRTTSVAELQKTEPPAPEIPDAWERIAAELSPPLPD